MKRISNFIRGISGETIRYAVVGAATSLIDAGLFALLHYAFGVEATVSNIASVMVAIAFAYIANKLFVFRSHCADFHALLFECARFIGGRLVTMVVEVALFELLSRAAGQEELIAKAASIVVVIIANYIISKFFVFRKGRQEDKPA